MRPENVAEEGRRHLIVLGIGRRRIFGDRMRRHGAGEGFLGLGGSGFELAPRAANEETDAEAGQRIRKRRTLRRQGRQGGEAQDKAPNFSG